MRAPFRAPCRRTAGRQSGPVLTERARLTLCAALVVILSLVAAFASVAPPEGAVIPPHKITRTR